MILLRLSLIFIFTLAAGGAQATFLYDNEERVIFLERDQLFMKKDGNDPVRRPLRFEMRMLSQNKQIWLPHISVTLGEGAPVESMSLSFPEIKTSGVTKSLKANLPDEKNKAFTMVQVSSIEDSGSSSYQSPFWGFLRSQHFVVLFLKMDVIHVTVQIDGEEWTTPVSLSNSTESYKEYAWKNPNQETQDSRVKKYLGPSDSQSGVKRIGDKALSTSYGYGLTEYGPLDQLLPGELSSEKLMDLDPKKYQDSFTKAEELYGIFTQRAERLQKVTELTSPTSFQSDSALLLVYAEDIKQHWRQGVVPLVGGSEKPQGRLIELIARVETLTQKLESLEQEIETQTSDVLEPTIQAETKNDEIYQKHESALTAFDGRINELTDQQEALQKELDEFSGLLDIYEDWLRSSKVRVTEKIEALLLEPEEIRQTDTQQRMRQQRIQKLASIQDQLKSSLKDLRKMVKAARAASESTAALQEFLAEKASLEGKIKSLNVDISATEEKFPQAIRDRAEEMNQKVEEEIAALLPEGQIRNGDFEVAATRKLIRDHYDSLDQWLEEFNPALKFTVCSAAHYKPYKEKYKGIEHCLSPFELVQDVRKSDYVNSLSPRELDQVLGQFIEGPLNPWRKKISKINLLADLTVEAIKEAESSQINPFFDKRNLYQALIDEWTMIQFLRWRVKLARALLKQNPELEFSADFYPPLIEANKAVYEDQLYPQRDALDTSLKEMEEQALSLLAENSKARGEYEPLAQAFVDKYITPLSRELEEINSLGEDPVLSRLSSCHFPIGKLDRCNETLASTEESREQIYQIEENQEAQTTYLMVQSLKAFTRNLTDQIRATSQKLGEEVAGKAEYLTSNGIEDLQSERAQIAATLEVVRKRLQSLRADQRKTKVQRRFDQFQQFYQASRLSIFTVQISQLKEQALPHEENIQAVCAQVLPLLKEMQSFEKLIIEKLNDGEANGLRFNSVAPACELPPLKEFEVKQL